MTLSAFNSDPEMATKHENFKTKCVNVRGHMTKPNIQYETLKHIYEYITDIKQSNIYNVAILPSTFSPFLFHVHPTFLLPTLPSPTLGATLRTHPSSRLPYFCPSFISSSLHTFPSPATPLPLPFLPPSFPLDHCCPTT